MMEKSKKIIHQLDMKLFCLKKALQTLQDGCDGMRERVRAYGESKEIQQFLTVLTAAKHDEKAALFNQNQVVNFHAKNLAYSQAKGVSSLELGYSHVRSRALFKLSCRTTLHRYVGKSTGEAGLIKERLRLVREGLVVEQ
ncbi:hypothetical protein HPB49_004076 [Dermacentor silvarum]|uniref:Uncharacterized protein n=1 Tax=Dermacentor silvarum TaxID=543639 RepID=A0ACB8CPB3_DERSI|nr:hypothetical protein HPB49_004076 [Dermacentor silvarum]